MQLISRLLFGISLVFAATAVVGVASDANNEAVKKDRKLYEGTWQIISLVVDGNQAGEEDAKKIIVVNEADGNWAIEVDGKIVAKGTSLIDPTKKPKAVDQTITEGDSKGMTILGIYEFGDDTRKVCYAPPGKDRPLEFASTSGSGHVLAVLKRVKK